MSLLQPSPLLLSPLPHSPQHSQQPMCLAAALAVAAVAALSLAALALAALALAALVAPAFTAIVPAQPLLPPGSPPLLSPPP